VPAPLDNPTHRALLRLCRLQLSDAHRDDLRALAPRVRWPELVQLARRGGVAGLVARGAAEVGAPRDALLELTKSALLTQAQNQVFADETLRLCGAAAEQGLTLVPIKGAALNLLLYRDLGLRAMCDLDLWASRPQLAAVEALLQRCGYRDETPRGYALRHSHHLKYILELGPRRVMVELHWTGLLADYASPDEEQRMLARARPQQLDPDGPRLGLLHPDDLTLVVILHLAVHRYRAQLKWLVDVAELARAFAVDWPALWAAAGRVGGLRAATLAALLARELLDAPIPTPPRAPWLLDWLRRASPPADLVASEPQASWPRRALVNLLAYDSPLHGLRFLARKGDELLERYHGIRLSRRDRSA
jgi:hypothetical protein